MADNSALIGQLQQQIAALTQQLQQLTAGQNTQQPGPAPTSGGSYPAYAPNGLNLAPNNFTYNAADPMAYLKQQLGANVNFSDPASIRAAAEAQHATFDRNGNPVPSRYHSHATDQNMKELYERWQEPDRGYGTWLKGNNPLGATGAALMNALYPGSIQPGSVQYQSMTGQIDPQKWFTAPQSVNKMGQWINPAQGVGTWMPMPGNWGGYQPGTTPGQYFGGAGGTIPSAGAIATSMGNAGVTPWW